MAHYIIFGNWVYPFENWMLELPDRSTFWAEYNSDGHARGINGKKSYDVIKFHEINLIFSEFGKKTVNFYYLPNRRYCNTIFKKSLWGILDLIPGSPSLLSLVRILASQWVSKLILWKLTVKTLELLQYSKKIPLIPLWVTNHSINRSKN